MFRKIIFSLFVLQLIFGSDGQRDKKFFRKDYKYIGSTQSFYKIHTMHKNWWDGKKTCYQEGAMFFYPENEDESRAVMEYMNDTTPFHWTYIGISDEMSKGIFETVDGIPITEVYTNWEPGEPNDGNKQDCAILRRELIMKDEDCENKYPFTCKKTLASLQWNTACNMPFMSYTKDESLGKCYKFHLNPATWAEAYAACSAEQSYLAVINSQQEADYLANLTDSAPRQRVKGNYLRGAIWLGFRNKYGTGWNTVTGTTLEDSGYSLWGNLQPDGGDEETCGSMFHNGHLNDLGCEQKVFFICEHDIDSPKLLLDDRFGES